MDQKVAAAWQQLLGFSKPFQNDCFAEMIPKTWIEAFEGDVGFQSRFEQSIGVGCKGPFPPEFRLIQGWRGGSNCFHSLQSRPRELFDFSWPIWSREVRWLLTARLGCRMTNGKQVLIGTERTPP